MYGSTFNCGIEKIGDNHVTKFYFESLNDKFTPENNQGEQIEKSINMLLDIVFNPLLESGRFKEEYVNSEKNNIKQLIESKIDNKDSYAASRCIEEMYEGKGYGLYKYGYVEDLDNITAENLYEYYSKLMATCKIDIFVSGDISKNPVEEIVAKNENIVKLDCRDGIITRLATKQEPPVNGAKVIEEKMDIAQGKLVLGITLDTSKKGSRFPAALYNVILGESATSKLFQNVREKESLAYTIRSRYVKQKANIYISAGIEVEKYEKTLEIIKEQLQDMKTGNFTEEDLNNAKKYLISGIKSVKDEQDSEIVYYIGQEFAEELTTFEEYEEKVNTVTREDIEKIADSVQINTVYFLRN